MATSSTQLTDDYACSFCLQKLTSMSDPRELPCTHVFCLSCLKDDISDAGMSRCKVCRQTYEIENLLNLPKINLPSSSNNLKEEQKSAVLCDICTQNHEPTVVFCTDCSKNFCKEHEQMHTLLHGREHVVTAVQLNLSEAEACENHSGNILTKACRTCRSMFCSLCSTDSDCPTASGANNKEHSIIKVGLLAEELRNRMRAVSATVSCSIDAVCSAEKLTPNNVSDVESKVSQIIRTVDLSAKNKILDIQNASAAAKEKLKAFSRSATNESITHSKKLKAKRERLQGLLQMIHQTSSGSDQSVIAAQRQLASMLREADINQQAKCQAKFSPHVLNKLEYVCDQDMSHLIVLSPPCALNFDVSLLPKSTIVLWNSEGWVVSSNLACVQFFDREFTPLQSHTLTSPIVSLAQSTSQSHLGLQPEYLAWTNTLPAQSSSTSMTSLFGCTIQNAAHSQPQISSKAQLQLYDAAFKPTKLFDSRNVSSSISVTVNYKTSDILTLHENKLDILSMDGDLLCTVTLNDKHSLQAVLVLPDNGILILGDTYLYKYRDPVPLKTMTLLWKSSALRKPSAMTIGSDGYIYVGCSDGVHVLSPFGEALNVLTHQYLRSVSISDIAVSPSAEKIAIACGDNGLKVFTLRRG